MADIQLPHLRQAGDVGHGVIVYPMPGMDLDPKAAGLRRRRFQPLQLALEQRLGQTEKLATIGQLAAEIAHEVGTPLNVIAGRARAIQKKASEHPETVEKNAEIIAEQTARITRIIQRLLDFTRRKVGGAGKAEVNLNELALTTMELLSGQFSSAKVKTRLERSEGLPRIAGDSDRLQQVLGNLIGNAIKYGRNDGHVGVTGHLSNGNSIELCVQDDGPGIPPESLERVFESFYRVDKARSREQGGTGLGLSIVKHIVQSHGGKVWAKSELGKGAAFYFTLPAKQEATN